MQPPTACIPYGRPVIGYDEIVKGFTREDVLRFYRNWYVPENLVWVMVGDLDPEALMPELEARLSRIPNRPLPVQKIAVEPPQSAPRVFVQQEDAKEARLKIGFHIPDISDPDVPALDLLAQILGQGRSSRLYSSLRMERRLVNSISAYSMTPKDPGLFLVSSSLEAKDLDRALTGILEETFRVCFEPVTIQELKKAKTQIESDFIYQKQTVQGQARELGYYEAIVGDLGFGEKYLDAASNGTRRRCPARCQDLSSPPEPHAGHARPEDGRGSGLEEEAAQAGNEHIREHRVPFRDTGRRDPGGSRSGPQGSAVERSDPAREREPGGPTRILPGRLPGGAPLGE